MENHKNDQSFQYHYSAREQEELKRIRSKYLPKEEDKMERLRRLDSRVAMKATTNALIAGIIGTLIFGIGMCCCMVWAESWFVPGIVLGLIGFAVLGTAYPIYNRTLEKERKKIAPEILRLADELMK